MTIVFQPKVLGEGEYVADDYDPADYPTRDQAVLVARKAAEFIATQYGGLVSQGPVAGDGPFACAPGFHSTSWTVAYEGAYDWTVEWCEHLYTHPDPDLAGLFLEPVTGWCLGIYLP